MKPKDLRPHRAAVAAWMVSLSLAPLARAGADEEPRAIFVMKSDGSAVRRVVMIEAFRWLGSPRWSHDGKKLAFAASGGPSGGPFGRCLTVDTSGRNLLDLGAGSAPDWSPDDKQVVFEVPNVGGFSIWVQNADGKGNSWLAGGRAPRWSPDGTQIAVIGPPLPGLRILDVVSGSERAVFDAKDQVKETLGCDWSPDGRRLAAVVERNGARELVIVSAEGAGKGLKTRLRADSNGGLAWSADGKKLAISMYDEKLDARRLHTIDPDGNDPPALIAGQQGDNREPAWSPDGTQLAFASSRKTTDRPAVAVAKVRATLELVRSHDKGGTVYSVAFSPDGRTAFVGGDMAHQGMQVWDASTGEVLRDIPAPGIFVAVSPDGLRAAYAEFIGVDVQYLDLEDGSLVRQFAHGAPVTSLQFSGDGSRLVSAGSDKMACVFDVATGTRLARIKHAAELKQVAFSPDGKLIASTSVDKKLYLWEATTGKKLREMDHPAEPWSVAFSPDGRRVMTGTGGTIVGRKSDLEVPPSEDNTLREWDVETGKLLHEMKGHTHVVSGVAYSPDGKLAVSASFDRSLRLWDVEREVELSRVDGKGWVTQAVFSADGRQVLASGGAEKNIERKRWYEAPDERVRLFNVVRAPERKAEDN
jgi:WD40 repeat protein